MTMAMATWTPLRVYFADNVADPQDSGYHGTHVAGTVAAVGKNQLGVIGVDYQAKIMALKASNDGNSLQ